MLELDNKWLKRWHDFLVVVILLECIYTPLECGFNGLCPLFLRLLMDLTFFADSFLPFFITIQTPNGTVLR